MRGDALREGGPRLTLGLGCDRGTPEATIARAVDEALAQAGARLEDVAAVASIALKADEPGLLALARRHRWRIAFHPPEVLADVAVPNPSETVRRYTGTPSVSEAAALLAAGTDLATDPGALLVEKHKLRGADGRNATVSIARLPPPIHPHLPLGQAFPSEPPSC
ncbi:cobalamin biosynthesis protein [Thauera aromatica]|uniref:cobalamin biosynthesis protein n=1 Tax=Thauera aromatica TaxID=59405 RepID=UPI001FFCAB6D|nr:cobalamin biosynthesis protein [Thauera aromatica]